MARSIQATIATRTARLRLPARKAPYWQTLTPGTAIGYYRPASCGDGSWWGRARIGGRYLVEALATADDHTDADGERVLSWPQAQAAVRAWADRQANAGPLTVAGAVSDYLTDLRARKGEKAATGAAGRLAKHFLPALGDRQISDLTDHDLRSWRNSMVPAGDEERVRRARDTANRNLNIVKAVLNLAFRAGRIADDRAWRRVEPFKGVGVARKVLLTDLELQRLVDACEPGLRELVAVGAETGARLGELTNTRVRDLDLDASTLKVSGKTGTREIHLATATIQLLRRCAAGKRPGDLLLPPADQPAWTHNLPTKRFARAVRRAGLDPNVIFYSLRHTFISRALRNLIPVKAVADHCGTSMAMVEVHYAKFIIADRQRYAELAAPGLRVDGADDKVVRIR